METKTTKDIINKTLGVQDEDTLRVFYPNWEKDKLKKWTSIDGLWEWIEKNKHLPKDSMMNKFVNELPLA